MKKVLITGIAGQDGSYLAEFLLNKGYKVDGLLKEKPEEKKLVNVAAIIDKLDLHYGDMSDAGFVVDLIKKIQPDEIYHLASGVEVMVSFGDGLEIFKPNLEGTFNFLSAIKEFKPDCRFYFAATAKVFGNPSVSPQNENTPFNPVSPYGIAKTTGLFVVKMFREAHGVFACSGILYNHESPRRDQKFLVKKITSAVAKIKLGIENKLELGNIEAKRDWGFAGDYVEAMWLMLQADKPNDYAIGTGEEHSVKEVLEVAFKEVGLDWQKYVVIEEKFFAKESGVQLVADVSKLKNELGWRQKTSFEELVKKMVNEDIRIFKGKND